MQVEQGSGHQSTLEPDESDFFEPADPPTSQGPALSSATPEPLQEPHPVSMSAEAEDVPPIREFPQESRLPFEGLLYIGKLETTFVWMGHKFRIRTLTNDETLEVALVCRQWTGTMGEAKAYATACAAASLISVDDKALPEPIGPGESRLESRFNFVKTSYYPPTIDAVFEQFLLLDDEVQGIIEAMGNVSG